MHALKDYGSDSEHSEDSESVNDDMEKETSSKNVMSNYFGMLSGKSSASFLNKDEKRPLVSDKKKLLDIKVEDEKKVTVEIPSSSFWSDVKSDELKVLHQTSNYDGRDIEHSSMLYRRNCAEKDRSSQQKRICDYNSSQSYSKRQMTSIQSAKALGKQSDTNETCKILEKRKLFIIHPKILPLTHSRQKKCTTPGKKEWENPGHAGAINRLKWNVPNFSHLLATASMDSSIKIWNVWSQLDPCVQVLSAHSKAVRDVDWNNDGKQLLSCSYDKSARLWDIEAGVCLSNFNHSCYVTCCKYHPVNHHVVVTGSNNQIQTWDSRTPSAPSQTFRYKDNIGQVQDILITVDGSTLFSCTDLVSRDSADRNLMAWDMHTGVVLSNQIYQERFTLNRLQVHPTDGQLFAQSTGDYIALFSLQCPYKMNKHKRFEGHKVQGYNIGFDISSDGQIIYSGSSDGKIHCYNYQSGKQWLGIHTGLPVLTDVACHPVLPSTLAAASWDGTVQVWR